MSVFRRLSVLAAGAIILACSESPTQPIVVPPVIPPVVEPPVPVVSGVTITGPTRLTVGRSDVVVATPRTSAGVAVTGKTVAYSSSNPAAVTVTAAGAVAAVAPGTAVITATVEGVSATLSIVSSDATFTSFTIAPPATPVYVGGTGQFTASARDSVNVPVAIRSITYTSSNQNIATVSPSGLVTGRAPGVVTISAEAIGNVGLQASAQLTVQLVPISSVVIAATDTILQPFFPKQLLASARDSAGNVLQRPITYTTSNVDVAVLDDFGLVTATGKGPVTVTATSGGKSSSIRLYVPADSGIFVTTIGGTADDQANVSIDIPNSTSPTTQTATIGTDLYARTTFNTQAGTYRIRANTTPSASRAPTLTGIALLIGEVSGVVASSVRPPSVVVNVPLKAYTATITAPTSTTVNTAVTVTWSFDESLQSFNTFPDQLPAGTLYVGTTNGPDLSGQAVAATVTRLASGVVQFSATFNAPSSPGTVYIQVSADGPTSRLLYPIALKGQTLRAITVQ